MAQLVEHRAVTREVAGSNPGRINTQDLKITEKKVLQMIRLSSLLGQGLSTVGPVSQISSMFISSLWDVKVPKHYSRRVGDKVPGVVAVLFSPAEVAGLAVMSLKRLVVYEAT